MADLTAQRTLVKSPPELWTELSEVESLARHLGELGEIRITKVEPESTVAWEGEQISGTVRLEQSGWGTKVTLNATVPEPDPAPEADAIAAPEVVEPPSAATKAEAEPREARRDGFWARWLFRQRRPIKDAAAAEPPPAPVVAAVEPAPHEPEDATPAGEADLETSRAIEPQHVQAVLDDTLDALGQAHHRPFSRG